MITNKPLKRTLNKTVVVATQDAKPEKLTKSVQDIFRDNLSRTMPDDDYSLDAFCKSIPIPEDHQKVLRDGTPTHALPADVKKKLPQYYVAAVNGVKELESSPANDSQASDISHFAVGLKEHLDALTDVKNSEKIRAGNDSRYAEQAEHGNDIVPEAARPLDVNGNMRKAAPAPEHESEAYHEAEMSKHEQAQKHSTDFVVKLHQALKGEKHYGGKDGFGEKINEVLRQHHEDHQAAWGTHLDEVSKSADAGNLKDSHDALVGELEKAARRFRTTAHRAGSRGSSSANRAGVAAGGQTKYINPQKVAAAKRMSALGSGKKTA